MGWAFKKDTNDTRESAAINIADYLLHEQAYIAVHDPQVKEKQVFDDLQYLNSRSLDEIKKGIAVFENPYETCKSAHAIAILTEWDEFREYDWQKIYDNMQKPAFIFDGRNILDAKKMTELGFIFCAVGSTN